MVGSWQKQLLIDIEQAAKEDGFRTDSLLWGKVRAVIDQYNIRLANPFKSLRDKLISFANSVTKKNVKVSIPILDGLSYGGSFSTAKDIFLENNLRLIGSIPAQDLNAVADVFKEAANAGRSVSDIAQQLEHKFKVSRVRAQLIANDQTLKLNAAINKERQIRAGITKYVWTTARDEKVRGNPLGKYPLPRLGVGPDHWRLDGTVQLWIAPPIVDTRTLRRAHPGEDIQCRCLAYPILEEIKNV